MLETPSKPRNKPLSTFTLVMINVIAIDSLRNLPMNAKYGTSVIFFYVLAGILFLLPCLLVSAELATNHAKTGGAYVWSREAFGPRMGFMMIFLQWIYNVIWYPTILSFICDNIAYLIDPQLANNKAFVLPLSLAFFYLATLFNAFGMRVSGWLSNISAILGTIIPMIIIIALAIFWFFSAKPVYAHFSMNALLPSGLHMNNIAYFVTIMFSLMGFEMSAVHAGDVKNPQKDYPRALYWSASIVVLTMIFSSLAIAMVVPNHSLNIVSGIDQAFVRFFGGFHLEWVLPIAILCVIIGGFGGMSAWVVGPAKGLMVAAEDKCAPAFFARKNKHHAPIGALWLQIILVTLLSGSFLLFKQFTTAYLLLNVLSAQLALLFYIILFASAIMLRYKRQKIDPNAFLIPGGKVGVWLIALVGIVACVAAIFAGFVPPKDLHIANPLMYEAILIIGIAVFLLVPWYLSRERAR